MHLALGCPSRQRAANLLPLVSGWATNLKLNLGNPAQPARKPQGGWEGARPGTRTRRGRLHRSGRGPNPAPWPKALRAQRPYSFSSKRGHSPHPTSDHAAGSRRPFQASASGACPSPPSDPVRRRGPSPRTPPPSAPPSVFFLPIRRQRWLGSTLPPLWPQSHRPYPLRTTLSHGSREEGRGLLTVLLWRGAGRVLGARFTTACGCAARLTAAPHCSWRGHSGDGVGLGVSGSVGRCGAFVRDGPRMRLPGQDSGLGGPPCGRSRECRARPRGVVQPRLVAAARPLEIVESRQPAAGAGARGPLRGVASCCSFWERLAAAVTASPRIRR